MGKLGACELNYSSDVDLVILYDHERTVYTGKDSLSRCMVRLARELGVVVTALVQSVLGGLGLLVAGIPFPGLLTALMFLLAVAQVGAALVLAGAAAWCFATDAHGWGVALVVWTVVVGVLDNFLRPWLIQRGADLPLQNSQAVFSRMITERNQLAQQIRAEGNEEAQKITAQAEREVIEIKSKAQEEAEKLRGAADAERNAVFAAAYGKDPEFFAFYRSLIAYEEALRKGDSTVVLSPDSEFLRYLNDVRGRR